ncbi:MAG TPA: DUF2914 domain-containing protein [Myxococcaceae bacterium]|nr:DUF2914 domain-containing protein [Myxococcaceae bacterium]
MIPPAPDAKATPPASAEGTASAPETQADVQPAVAPVPAPLSWTGRLQAFRGRYAKTELALFFSLGFLFDVFTLSRIDDWLSVLQQGVYLLLLGTLLAWEARTALGVGEPPRLLRKAWRFSEGAIHFLFGSLLSVYSLLYLKSASSWASLGFLGFLFALLVANELPRFRKLGMSLRFGLYGFCLTSYFAYLGPVLVGFISPWLFVTAALVSLAPFWFFFSLLRRWKKASWPVVLRLVMPGIGVQAALLALYFLGAVPPVPLALEFMGVYHGVERDGTGYKLLHLRPEWRIWHRGDQQFEARTGDRVYCFVRIFAPAKFQDQVKLRWSYDDPGRGWVTWDAIPLVVTGGRDGGFRGYSYKERYRPGRWRVAVETADGQEIGSMKFTIHVDTGMAERQFKVDRS